ncbi:vitamin K epoxide reductase family protein [Myxococcota bacterium]
MREVMSLLMEHPVAGGSDNVADSAGARRAMSVSRRWMLCFALISLLGIAVAVELTRIHVFVHTDPSYHSVCAMSEGVNCETVAVSPYSVFAGLPVSVWGLAGYLLMGGLGLWSLGKRRLHSTWPLGLLLVLTAFSVGISAVLAFISATRINSFCLFCTGSYAVNAGLLVVSLAASRRTRFPIRDLLLHDLKALVARPVVFAVLALAGFVTLGALLAFVPSYWKTPGWSDLPKLVSGTDESGHHWIGARNPRLTIVEFSDYECPHCRAAHKAMRVLAAEHPEQIRLIHRHLPLDMTCHPGLGRPFHARACLLAEAAECAGVQGRFWEMNDALFSIQETVKTQNVDSVDLAVRIGLNRLDFKRCLENHATAERIAVDVRESMARKLNGTPSFLVGDELFLGRIPEAELEQLLVATP